MEHTSTTVLRLTGLHCAGCVRRVEAILEGVDGVQSAQVNLATSLGTVSHMYAEDAAAALCAAVDDAGYGAQTVIAETALADDFEGSIDASTVIWAILLSFPVFVMEMGGHLFPAFHAWVALSFGMLNSWMAQLVLTSLVLAGPGRSFFVLGARAVMRRTPDMNLLVAIGTGAAFGFSVVAVMLRAIGNAAQTPHVYFESACVIICLILLGRYLENTARGRAGAAVRALARLQPNRVLIRQDDQQIEIALADVKRGDVLVARPGDAFAVDGSVVQGESHVDESMLTGETTPVFKGHEDSVTAGSLNGNGTLYYRAERLGQETYLSQIMQLVQQAQASKLPVQSILDRVTAWFVPAILGVATVTFAVWLMVGAGIGQALISAVSVLIVACPCAMGLAVPVSVVTSIGRAAGLGILVRNSEALQRLSEIRTLGLDKTGTLTTGQMDLVKVFHASTMDRDSALKQAAALASASDHPVSRAIAKAFPHVQPVQIEALAGQGIRAGAYVLASATWVANQRIEIPAEWGAASSFLVEDGVLLAGFEVRDTLRAGAEDLVRAFQAEGVALRLISGDSAAMAERVAAQVGLTDVHADMMPDEKLSALNEMKGPVAFVGDGINDGPVLAHADVGIALASGNDVAAQTADIVITADNLQRVHAAWRLSVATMANVRQNLFWAFGYNVALIPLAAGVFYPAFGVQLQPGYAAAAMALSSLCVVLNALRLRRLRI